MDKTTIKIAYIGGGSRYWARDLMADLALSPRLQGTIDLYDIDQSAAEKNVAISKHIFSRPAARTRFTVRAVRRLAEALRGADFVVISTEPGPITMRYADLVIPARHGLIQPVGDSTGPGGIMRALRAIPEYIGFAQAIGEHCPRAWVINYTNPMTLCTAALYAGFPGIKAFGCCHEVFHTQHRLAEFVSRWFDVERPARQEISLDIAGVNHFTWATAATWQGRDLFPQLAREIAQPKFFADATKIAQDHLAHERWFTSPGLIAYDLFRRFGALGAAGDRHLAEFVPWYLGDGEAGLNRWGVISTPYSWRKKRRSLRDHPVDHYLTRPLKASGEEGVAQMEALLGLGNLDTNVNLPNHGQIASLPTGAVVETYAQFRRDRLVPIVARPLPAAAAGLVHRIADVQALTLAAARNSDVDAAFAALLADPLVHLPTESAWKMFVAMLRHCRPCLTRWRLPLK
jgi:galacturan 1,4-alpha-galacturonidase